MDNAKNKLINIGLVLVYHIENARSLFFLVSLLRHRVHLRSSQVLALFFFVSGFLKLTTMESLILLVNTIQRACTTVGDYGGGNNALSSLWEALPSVAVVGGQVSSQSDKSDLFFPLKLVF